MPAATQGVVNVRAGTSDIAGRGVFAVRPIAEGELIEECFVLRVPQEQVEFLDKTIVYEYYFAWDGDAGVAHGFGGLYNHSSDPNARYTKNYAEELITFRAIRSIGADEEITIDYGG